MPNQYEQAGAAQAPYPPQHLVYGRVVVTDVDMPFWSMVGFMIKWAFASIPAMFIVGIVLGCIFFVIAAVFGVLGSLGGAGLPR